MMCKTVAKMGFKHLDPVREDEATLELACRDTAMKEVARIVALFLTAADDQLDCLPTE